MNKNGKAAAKKKQQRKKSRNGKNQKKEEKENNHQIENDLGVNVLYNTLTQTAQRN